MGAVSSVRGPRGASGVQGPEGAGGLLRHDTPDPAKSQCALTWRQHKKLAARTPCPCPFPMRLSRLARAVLSHDLRRTDCPHRLLWHVEGGCGGGTT